ncbi:Ger(x)C family spore germination protein [Microaerobacter geothermalis]|uniref:Ger(x)C family spore germination protein n=1 Tax=Microaerobacter geothermalis TaxID=674972 RepID=UPI001F1AAA08|nr:Ger(x)C family spore germination protein [Microaerobacter geothermalis]MCF6093301.1 Ger(x)C family spore germination protein [Microaerobacter geothermalis]
MFVFVMIFSLSGCWDSRELNDLALVMAVGIDKVKNTDDFRVTVQIAKPSGGGQPGKGGSAAADEPVWTASAEGNTIFEAIRNLAKFSSRRIMWAHNNIIIIGESVARDDITPVIDFFTRNVELRMRTWVAVARGEARNYVSAKTGLENIPAMSISSLFRYSELPSESVKTEVIDLFSDFLSDSIQPMVSGLRMRERVISTENKQEHGGEKQVELAGGAVFKDTKLVGWVSPEETRGLAWIRNEMNNAIITVPCGKNKKKQISIELRYAQTDLISKIDNNMPSITIKASARGDITEQDCLTHLSTEQLKEKVEQLANDEIRNEIKLGVKKVQKEFKSDILGFGRTIHIQHREKWYGGIKEKWEEIFPEIPVTVQVDIHINKMSLYQEPMKIEKVESGNYK